MVNYKSDTEGIKQALKKEIIRLGIQDNPSRTVYQKKYERGVAPSPNNAIKVTGMKWQELMEDLGFEYDGKKNISLSKNLNVNPDRATRYNYDNPEVRKEIMDRVVNAVRENGYTKPVQLRENLKSKIDISYATLLKHGFTWNEIVIAYKEKFGEPIISTGKNQRTNWNQFTNKELLDIITKVIRENNCSNLDEYDKNYRPKYNTPYSSVLLKRFGVTVPELWRMIQINGDLPLK